MADVGVTYTFTTPGTDITFNDGGLNQFYITEFPSGLGSATMRVPLDNVPLGDGGIIHPSWKAPRHFTVEGLFLIESTLNMDAIVVIRNQMEADLISAWEAVQAPASGTFAWTPQGQGARSLTVYADEIPVDIQHRDNYLSLYFTFGLVAPNPVW